MNFKEEYTSEALTAEKGEENKLTLTNEAYAIGLLLEKLINTIERKGLK